MKNIILTALILMGCNQSQETKPASLTEPTVKSVEVVSHRGINAADNTLDSFYNAINLGFDSIETDLRMHNGDVVLAHDKTIDGVKYETLDNLLVWASNNDVKLWLETKEHEAVRPAIEKLSRYDLDVVFFSVRNSDIDLAKQLAPSISTGLLITREEQIKNADAEWIVIYHPFLIRNYEKIKHMEIATWTIREQSDYDELELYSNAIISDISINK